MRIVDTFIYYCAHFYRSESHFFDYFLIESWKFKFWEFWKFSLFPYREFLFNERLDVFCYEITDHDESHVVSYVISVEELAHL